jgi:hypothetical protein
MAGFYESATILQAPILGILKAKQPIVSGGRLKNSRFWEIVARDRVRPALFGPACSATRRFLHIAGVVNQGVRLLAGHFRLG